MYTLFPSTTAFSKYVLQLRGAGLQLVPILHFAEWAFAAPLTLLCNACMRLSISSCRRPFNGLLNLRAASTVTTYHSHLGRRVGPLGQYAIQFASWVGSDRAVTTASSKNFELVLTQLGTRVEKSSSFFRTRVFPFNYQSYFQNAS